MAVTLIADSGATKAEWRLAGEGKTASFFTQGISPYFLDAPAIAGLLRSELLPVLGRKHAAGEGFDAIHYYGAGCANPANARMVRKAIEKVFPGARVSVQTDLMAAARAVCGHEKGLACILGTGSNSCYYNGRRIVRNRPGLGYVLGDEASGAYLGKKVVQHYLYDTFDEDLRARFDARFATTRVEILDQVYKKPLPNRYLAGFTLFLAENRGHYMIENIIEDGLNDFFFQHLCKYPEVWKHPVHFVGSVAYGFRDVLRDLCASYEFELGRVVKNPMEGLAAYHGL